MQKGKFNILIDGLWGSSGKGKMSTFLADKHGVTHISSSNFPNAGHTAAWKDGYKFIAKAIPTAACLKKVNGTNIDCFISPGSGFSWPQFIKEWDQAGRPKIHIHKRASIVDDRHKAREAEGKDSTKHIASTMQGSAAAICDKILRKADIQLVGQTGVNTTELHKVLKFFIATDPYASDLFEKGGNDLYNEFLEKVDITDPSEFRRMTWNLIDQGNTWLHEGSQGFALSIDHGSHYPHCTSRNCTVQASMDHMAIPHQLMGDVYINLRTFPIRVGNIVEDGKEKGYSGDFYSDCEELTWEQVANMAGMPDTEKAALAERERTTVTKRIRRVSTFSYEGLVDAVKTNGATKLCMNFIQYINWQDNGLKGGKEAFDKLSNQSRAFIDKVEKAAGVPVVLIGTGANHDDIIDLT